MKSRPLAIVFTVLCITAAILVALVYWGQRHILFPRHAAPAALSESDMPSHVERIWLTHSDGRTEAWLFMNRVRKTPQPLVVFAHGNAELIDYQMPIVKGYQRLGFAVALLEYRGYGRSDGQPSEDVIVADGLALVDRLLKRKGIDPDRIVYHGRSLGGGVLASLSNRHSPSVLILESTFRSVKEMARGMGLPAVAVRDPFDTQATLVKFEKPVLVFHGRRDQVVPVSHGQILAEIAPNSTLHILDCGHNDCPPNPQAYWQIIHDVFAANGILEPKS